MYKYKLPYRTVEVTQKCRNFTHLTQFMHWNFVMKLSSSIKTSVFLYLLHFEFTVKENRLFFVYEKNKNLA